VGRRIDVDELVGAQEIADLLDVARPQVIHGWRGRNIGFPEPVQSLSMGHLWYWPDVKAWAIKTGRLSKTGEAMRPPRSTKRDED
jgi:hypothetical protein